MRRTRKRSHSSGFKPFFNVITPIKLLSLFSFFLFFLFFYYYFSSLSGGWSPAGSTRPATDWPIVPAPGDHDDGEFGGMKIDKGNRSIRRKPAPASLCPTQIPLDQNRD
jgi:hypothetical protein